MRQAEPFAFFHFFPKSGILLIQVKEGVQITGIGILELVADIAGVFLLRDPGADGIAAFRRLMKAGKKRRLSWGKRCKLFLHLVNHSAVMGL